MSELRWNPDQAVQVEVLGEKPAAGTGRILELSGKRLRLAAGLKLTAGAAVRLQWDGQMLLGEVLSSEPDGCWMEISHMLLDTTALSWQQQGWNA
jgi:hypothetical protein